MSRTFTYFPRITGIYLIKEGCMPESSIIRVNDVWCGECERYQGGFCVVGIHGCQLVDEYSCTLFYEPKVYKDNGR